MNETEREKIVKQVLKELKTKKLFNSSRLSFRSTEKVLYSLNVLPEALELINDEIKQLEMENNELTKAPAKSSTLVLNERDLTYVYGDEILETKISELKQIQIKTKSQIRLVKNALRKIEKDKYYNIIPLYYFKNKTIEEIAEENDWAVGTVSKHKKD
ncbi:MAG: hypothetical protein V8R01_01515 [Bacilli bacterium]